MPQVASPVPAPMSSTGESASTRVDGRFEGDCARGGISTGRPYSRARNDLDENDKECGFRPGQS